MRNPATICHRIKPKLAALFMEDAASNRRLAVALGLGVFMGLMPGWGVQTWLALGMACLLRLNKPLMVLGSNISLPPLLPVILFASIQMGSLVAQGSWMPITLQTISWQFCREMVWYYLLGSFVLATVVGSLVFALTWICLHWWRGTRTVNGERIG